MLRIATINIRQYTQEGRGALSELAREISQKDFDILCCQDVPVADGGTNSTVQLAADTGMTCSFAALRGKKSRKKEKHPEAVSGTAILAGAHCCMLSSGSFALPGGSGRKKPQGQFAVVRKDGNALLVINIQLPPVKISTAMQREQLQAIFDHPILEKEYAAILFCGEFGIGQKGRSLKIFKHQSRYRVRDGFSSAVVKKISSSASLAKSKPRNFFFHGQICLLESKKNPVARVVFSNARHVLGGGRNTTPGQGAALDLRLTRIENAEVSQIYRYVSFIRPWAGPSDAELRSSFQPAWMGQANSLTQLNTAG